MSFMSFKREPSPDSTSLSAEDGLEFQDLNLKEKSNTKPAKSSQKTKKRKIGETSKTKIKNEPNDFDKDTSKRGTWTEDQDKTLYALITNNQGGNEVKAPWNEIQKMFMKVYPDCGKSLNSLKMRWRVKLRAGDTELTTSEKTLFRQAVTDIDGNERNLAYAWRFKELGGRDLNKSAASKLYKMLKAGQLEAT
ncbi:hypothetical protein H072_6902 [Dactylellina haptotyla CBS 200.50]|uniref:Myb-like domain-containing protein n=1 Tax=Dactylellina haptotyla (strain CBS 200.50) TaxID=1284197 RepID=S8A8I6_DACHA|nr:hypothetical protein H072_6902 [Dactylellina haptotyla CBS 200.50]